MGFEFQDIPGLDQPPDDGDTPRRGRRARAKSAITKKARRATGKSAADAADTKKGTDKTKAAASKDKEQTAKGAGSPSISFKRDVAPILVDNCIGCHRQGRPGLTRGKLDLTSFAKLMQGTPKEKVVTPGNADESHLVLRIKGEETPRMPQGGNNNGLAEEAIAKIEEWIKAGAKLDAGLDPKTAMDTYASSPDQVRRNKLAKMSSKEREQLVEKAGRDRWKKANPKLNPEILQLGHFALFSTLPKDRTTNLAKAMEGQYANLKRVLGSPATDWVEPVSLYLFNDRRDFVEFARSVENREVEAGVIASSNLAAAEPYVAVVDPQGGKKEQPAGAKRRPRTARGEDKESPPGSDRTLLGLLVENVADATITAQGKSPRWLASGLGAFMSSQVEPRSPYYQKLRQLAHQKYDLGWQTKATDALAETDQVSPDEIRAVGLVVVEFLMSPTYRAAFPAFARGMAAGKEKLDDVLREAYGASREDFLDQSGDWVAQRYGPNQ
jgi:hypothetical protein